MYFIIIRLYRNTVIAAETLEANSETPLVQVGTITFAVMGDLANLSSESLLERVYREMTAATADPMPLARAAPCIPHPNGPMNSQSRKMLRQPLLTDAIRAILGRPAATMNWSPTNSIMISGTNGARTYQ